MKDFTVTFIACFIAVFIGHYLGAERIVETCADFGRFKSRGVVYECKPIKGE